MLVKIKDKPILKRYKITMRNEIVRSKTDKYKSIGLFSKDIKIIEVK